MSATAYGTYRASPLPDLYYANATSTRLAGVCPYRSSYEGEAAPVVWGATIPSGRSSLDLVGH